MLCETLPRLEADEYPGGLWYYEPHTYPIYPRVEKTGFPADYEPLCGWYQGECSFD